MDLNGLNLIPQHNQINNDMGIEELRIGNYVFCRKTKKAIKVTSFILSNWESSQYKPIRLSVKESIKMGFKPVETTINKGYVMNVFNNNFFYNVTDNRIYTTFLNNTYCNYHYLHQFQNLIFALFTREYYGDIEYFTNPPQPPTQALQ